MEETNYDRKSQLTLEVLREINVDEKDTKQESRPTTVEAGAVMHPRKSYWQKLSLVDKKRENRMLSIMAGPFRFFSYPVVVYAGLMYGANGLVWSGVLNATAGTLYTKSYGFSTSDIAYAYLGGVLGVVVG